MGEEDHLRAVLKENVRKCREKIQKRMQGGDVIVTTITWKAVLNEMRKKYADLLTKEVESNLQAWFELLEEFPMERSRRESTIEPNSLNTPKSREDLVQPGDLWMACGSFPQEDVLLGSRSSDISSMDSSTRDMPEVKIVEGEDACEMKRDMGALFIHSDNVCSDDNRFPNYRVLDKILPTSKPWWSDMLTSSTEQGGARESSAKDEQEHKTAAKKEMQFSDAKESGPRATVLDKLELSGSSYFSQRTREVFKVSPRKVSAVRPKDKVHPKLSKAKSSTEPAPGNLPCSTSKAQPRPVPTTKKVKVKKRRKERSCLVKQDLKLNSSAEVSEETRKHEEKPKVEFPPVGYVYKRGDWVAHAIVSSSASSDDLRKALEDRGYELKHILKRKCTLPNKWVCSCVASADRTHILTSENIWLKGWEVDFVCNQEEIVSFLDE